MSTSITCSRAVLPRVASTSTRCRRFASTQAVASNSTAGSLLPKQYPEALSVKMHRRLYPEYYERKDKFNWEARDAVPYRRPRTKAKTMASKWAPVMRKDRVQTSLSQHFGIPIFAPSASNIKKSCPDPIAAVTASQTTLLDPSGARTRLFAKDNPECARVGDILLVRQRTGDPFAGVCINIRRRGVDTAILLRGQLTRVGVEMWYKVYSPLVEGIEVVQRAAKRARRARLTYMRTVKHDRGSVENVVRLYLRQKAALGTTDGGKKKGGAAAAAAMGGKKNKGRGKKR
ncbi:translation protein SH3-like domain-containing protein [Paraphoma chrysanthemicola]|nr:translation protein SH3-like domain-containing protein [Paraphoma chrysanthemicola]